MSPLVPAFRILRPLVHAWGRLTRGTVLGVRVVITDSDGRVALVRHAYETGWHFPGGGVERGETVEDAARREAREEAGCDPGELVLLGVFNNERSVPGDHVLLYRASEWTGCAFDSGPEIAERGWFDPEEAARIGSPATRRRLAELYEGGSQDAYW